MTKIKFVGALIFILSVVLALYSKHISTQNEANLKLLKIINEQKAFTQEIAKNIFFIYRNKDASVKQLDASVKAFVNNMNHKDEVLDEIFSQDIKQESKKIIYLWNDFYLLVQKFRDAYRVQNGYTNLVIQRLVKDIYNKNLQLVGEFNKLIEMHKKYVDTVKNKNKTIQITLFVILILLLMYLFSQLKDLITFIQKFLNTSKKIVQKSTVIGIKPIEKNANIADVTQAVDDFNFFVEKIDKSIDYSSESIKNASNSLECIEKNIEDLLELIETMDAGNRLDKELVKKEDILIEALDELSASLQRLRSLKINLDNFKK
ncbi:hypothetical protein [Sulfurimonas autotrophica]|uniref:NarX-like N-terminal domain-containing protein n=1 Tax=Sulfurimonas autotrophica (strain ATCC BAA-671 / DSM 16294 / JCM 11897 / OK10) TaxID=563040 RepID=E0URE6_SULAO|nr:hypothetical protein [Sulfurimonas autotrophica]ADN10032.1 conserved hypothetical protein [Sulfurimonas autotrophica DSM 16294]